MTNRPTTIARFRNDARKLTRRITGKFFHKAEFSVALTVSLPPFLKLTMTYKLLPADNDGEAKRETA